MVGCGPFAFLGSRGVALGLSLQTSGFLRETKGQNAFFVDWKLYSNHLEVLLSLGDKSLLPYGSTEERPLGLKNQFLLDKTQFDGISRMIQKGVPDWGGLWFVLLWGLDKLRLMSHEIKLCKRQKETFFPQQIKLWVTFWFFLCAYCG